MLKKTINKKNNNLSLIESMLIKISLNDNADKYYEWYNFICEKQKYDNKNKKCIFNYNEFVKENKILINFYNSFIRLNKILLNNDFIHYISHLLLNKYCGYVFQFAEYLLDRKLCDNRESINILFLNGDGAPIKK